MRYNFNPELSYPFNVIHPLQLRLVKPLLAAGMPAEVDGLLLYGSSVDLTCHPGSDLDLYVLTEADEPMEVYKKIHALCRQLKIKVDILVSNLENYLDSIDDLGAVEYDVYRTGVCLYAKN